MQKYIIRLEDCMVSEIKQMGNGKCQNIYKPNGKRYVAFAMYKGELLRITTGKKLTELKEKLFRDNRWKPFKIIKEY